MSTSSERARRAADAVKGKKAQSPSGKPAGAEGSATREERLAAAEAVAAEAAVAAAQAAEAAKAAVAAAAALRKEVKLEAEGSVGSPSPERRRRISPSPKRHRGRRGHSPIVQVYRDPGGGWPQLTHANYHDWSLLMKVKLQAQGLWDAVRYGNVDYDEDRRALEALCAAVPPEVGASIANKPTAKHAWEAIATRRRRRARPARHSAAAPR